MQHVGDMKWLAIGSLSVEILLSTLFGILGYVPQIYMKVDLFDV